MYATGQERKEDGKPCVTSVTIILFEITFGKNSLPFKRSFCRRPENIDVIEDLACEQALNLWSIVKS